MAAGIRWKELLCKRIGLQKNDHYCSRKPSSTNAPINRLPAAFGNEIIDWNKITSVPERIWICPELPRGAFETESPTLAYLSRTLNIWKFSPLPSLLPFHATSTYFRLHYSIDIIVTGEAYWSLSSKDICVASLLTDWDHPQ